MRGNRLNPTRVLLSALVVLAISAVAYGGADVLVEFDPVNIQNEISLTLIPGQPGCLAMDYNDLAPNSSIGVAYSSNSGLTWLTTNLSLPFDPTGLYQMTRGFDPTITADAQGKLYAGFIADGGTYASAPDSGLYVCTSSDYGKSWSAPITVAYDGVPGSFPNDPNYRYNDRDQITCDTFSGSSYYGNVYVSWIKDRGYYAPAQPWGDIYVSVSNNSGGTFTSAQQINDANVNHDRSNMPIPSVAADGAVYVSWLDYDCLVGGKGTIYLDKSTDGGTTWGTDITVTPTPIDLPPLRVSTGGTMTLDVLAKGAPVLATDPNNASTLYIAYAADANTADADEADIFLIKSTDSGANWGSPVKVNPDLTICDQILPWIEVKPDGTIDVAWYDRSADPNDAMWDVMISKSTDGGSTFSSVPVTLNDVSFATPSGGGGLWMGEYLGLALDSSNAYVGFTSSVADIQGDVWFDKIPNGHIPEPLTLSLLCLGGTALLRRRR